MGSDPIITKAQFYGRSQLEKGWVQHADTEMRINVFRDMTNWIQIFASPVTHTYFSLESYIITKVRTYGKADYNKGERNLYVDWFTFDTI
jgi:hypothetical protein